MHDKSFLARVTLTYVLVIPALTTDSCVYLFSTYLYDIMLGYSGFLCTVDYVQIANSDGQAQSCLLQSSQLCFVVVVAVAVVSCSCSCSPCRYLCF